MNKEKAYDPFDLAGQEQAKEEKKTLAKFSRDTEESDFKWLMSSRRGRRIIWRLLEKAGVFRTSFNTNSMQMAFNEGVRNEGLRTIALIHAQCPELYSVMTKEALDDNKNSNTDDGSRTNQ